jgi:hypothetical protein
MATLSLLVLDLCFPSMALPSPRNLNARNQERDASPGGDTGPPAYSHDGSWRFKTSGWGSSSAPYAGSWDHSSTVEYSASQQGGGDGGRNWGHTSTCAASIIIEISTSISTVYVPAPDNSAYHPAPTVYVTGPEHASCVPASTVTLAGPAGTSVLTITQPAVPTTVSITQNGLGWNRTITHEETFVATTTQRETSTTYNEETTTATSVVTLPGRPL